MSGSVKKRGFTILEVIIAVGILLFGLSAIFHLNSLTRGTSVGAEELASVQLACQTKMNEILATQRIPQRSVGTIPNIGTAGGDDWEMRIVPSSLPSRNLVEVRIIAQKRGGTENESDRRFELVRWIWNNDTNNVNNLNNNFNISNTGSDSAPAAIRSFGTNLSSDLYLEPQQNGGF